MISIHKPNWLSIAKTEYKVSTSRIREIRPFFPYLLIVGLAAYILLIAPYIVDLFVDELHEFLLSAIALALIQVFLFAFFVMFATLPITATLQDIKTDHIEIYLSAPIKTSDILIGEFVGKIPLYAAFAAIIGGTFTAALFPLGLDVFQIIIIVFVFILIFLIATWIGNICAVFIRSVLMKTARGRDIGKGLAIIVMFPFIALIYMMIGGYLEALENPQTAKLIQDIFQFFPWGWGAEIIVAFAQNPGDILLTELHTIFQFIGLLVLFCVLLLLGGLIANRVYNLEPTSFSASKSKSDGIFYSLIKIIGGGGSSGLLLSTGFKNYFRKMKNIAWLVYSVGLVLIMNVFLSQVDDPEGAFIMSLYISPLLAMFVASEITLQGKKSLLIYKQTPTGTGRLLKIKLYQYLLTILPIATIVEIIVNLNIPRITIEALVINVIFIVFIAIGVTIFTMGLFLLNPAYQDKSIEMMINMQICAFFVMISFFVLLISLDQILWNLFAIADALYPVAVILTIFYSIIGLLFLVLGAKKLSTLE